MFLEQVRKSSNTFVSYLLGVFILLLFTVIGQIPISYAIIAYAEGGVNPSDPIALLNAIPSNQRLVLQLLPFLVTLIGMVFINRFLHQQSFKKLISSRNSPDWNRVRFAFLVWGGITAILLAVGYLLAPSDYIFNFKWTTFLPLLLLGTLLIPIQTSTEELLFRGYLMQGFGVLFKNRWAPLLFTSVLFGSLHFANPEVDEFGLGIMIYYIGTGLFLGVITLIDEGLELAIGFHAANNLIGALLMSSEWTAFQTESIFIFNGQPNLWAEIILSLGICYPLIFFLFKRRYNWTAITHKLI